MYEQTPELDLYYVPSPDQGIGPDDAVRLGAEWLDAQPGTPLVLLAAKSSYDNNRLLPKLTAGAQVESVRTVSIGGQPGPVLMPWPSDETLVLVSGDLAHRISSVCVIGSRQTPFLEQWLSAHHAQWLVDPGCSTGPGSADLHLDPVVQAALRDVSEVVNHNNGLVQQEDKAYAIRTLQLLHGAGYMLSASAVCAWASANGFSGSEVTQLGKYIKRINEGHGFRLRDTMGPSADALDRWRESAFGQL